MRLLLAAAARETSKAAAAHARRDAAIRKAAESHTLREIATATGLSVSRVHQITKGQ